MKRKIERLFEGCRLSELRPFVDVLSIPPDLLKEVSSVKTSTNGKEEASRPQSTSNNSSSSSVSPPAQTPGGGGGGGAGNESAGNGDDGDDSDENDDSGEVCISHMSAV